MKGGGGQIQRKKDLHSNRRLLRCYSVFQQDEQKHINKWVSKRKISLWQLHVNSTKTRALSDCVNKIIGVCSCTSTFMRQYYI